MKLTMSTAGRGDGENLQKVLVIQTASIAMDVSELQWLVMSLSLSPGDELVLLSFLHLINSPPAFSFSAAAKILGYKGKEDPNSIVEEVRRKKEEYRSNAAFVQFHRFCEIHKIKASAEVEAGSSRKAAAVRAAKRLGATWIVLDREMKKDKQYFMDRLTCGISSMKSNNTIRKIRDPADEHVSYDEMIPSYSPPSESPRDHQTAARSKEREHYRSSKPLSCKSQSVVPRQEIGRNDTNAVLATADKSPSEGGERPEANTQQSTDSNNSICSICHNRRLKFDSQKDFTYSELREATNKFSRQNFLSEGGFGSVYKGELKKGVTVAVKRLKAASLQGEKEFKAEVRVLSRVRHQNLVTLLGSCAEGNRRLLVYEYICNGSLEEHLSGKRSSQPLTWEQRIKIAYGAAKGLAYLHARNIIHRDMRPGNILITHDYESLLGDFGLARAAQQEGSRSSENGVVGTLGYMAPEYAERGKMSTKTDVYSFGVVLLQLITGLRTTDEIPGGKSLVGWAKPLLEMKNYPRIIDKRILDSYDVHQLFWMVLVAENCLKKDPKDRYTMELVENRLQCINNIDLSLSRGESSC
ncbi:probable serine/threonine-protein kinase PBL7 [Andrographis paniculata]|uniref:probable serine/threonine-protein kinase PBL7 n=1 Tax=Andrographis paniculata TaxID=175694 RepID=UPI0021E79AC5|nr:probable serine/threonine-protein kinase PBL7 [Andrographis paniculata]